MKKLMLSAFLSFITSYVLAQQGTLLVANKADSSVMLIDLASCTVKATLPVGRGPHEVAVNLSGKMAAVANYGDRAKAGNSISVIDIVNKRKLKDISLEKYLRPHGMEFISEEEVLVTSEANKALLKVNITTGEVSEVAATNQLTSHMVAYSYRDKMAYVANIASGTVSAIDVSKNVLLRQIPFKKGIEGLAVSPDGKELWVANRDDSTVTAISTGTDESLAVLQAEGVAYRVKFTPDGRYVLVSNGMSGTVSVYDVAGKKTQTTISLVTELGEQPVPVGIAVSRDSQWAFVCTAGYSEVAMIRMADWSVVKRITTGQGPDGVYYSPVVLK